MSGRKNFGRRKPGNPRPTKGSSGRRPPILERTLTEVQWTNKLTRFFYPKLSRMAQVSGWSFEAILSEIYALRAERGHGLTYEDLVHKLAKRYFC